MKTLLLLTLLISPLAARAEPNNYVASYRVPTPDSLQAFATFEVPYQATQAADGQTTLTYTLPATLLGQPRNFTLTGKIDPKAPSFTLHAADADMTCDSSTATVQCQVSHHGVTVDLAGVQSALDAAGVSPAEKEGRFQVASFVAREGGDLVGVFLYSHADFN